MSCFIGYRRSRRGDGSSAYLASSWARDLFERSREAFTWNGIEVPDPAAHRGAEYLAAFEATLRSVADWLESNL